MEEIARQTDTSKASVSRFLKQIGYDSYQDVKHELADIRMKGYPLKTDDLGNDFVEEEMLRISQTWQAIDVEQINQIIEMIDKAPRVTIIGMRNSYPVALHLRQQLMQVRDRVRILPHPGQTLSEELLDDDINARELFILVAFRRRPSVISKIIDTLKDHDIVMLADPSALTYKDKVSKLLICQLGQSMPLDSYAAPMSVVSVICNGVLSARGEKASDRIKGIAALYSSLNELE